MVADKAAIAVKIREPETVFAATARARLMFAVE